MPGSVWKTALFLLLVAVPLSACQQYETYTNTSLGFTFDRPVYWSPYEPPSSEGVAFIAKNEGDVTIWIRVFDEVSAITAIESLNIQVDEYLEGTEPLTEVMISTHEHSEYEIASAQFTVPSSNTMFEIDIYSVVIQNRDKMAVIYAVGDGFEPEKAAEAIINSLEFLSD